MSPGTPAPLLILGAGGTLGRALAYGCERRGIVHRALLRRELGIADAGAVARALAELRPWGVVNAAGWVRVDEAEAEPEACARANADGPAVLAEACARHGARLLTYSTDLVFDGRAREPYLEDAPVAPLNVYGRTKADAERRVLAFMPSAVVARTSAFFGPGDVHNFAVQTREALARGDVVRAASDTWISPTYVPHLVDASLDLVREGAGGIHHLANAGAMTWETFAREVAASGGLDESRVEGVPMAAFGLPAPRPLWSVLGTARGPGLPPFGEALDAFTRAMPAAPA